jgi:hypothetical protein
MDRCSGCCSCNGSDTVCPHQSESRRQKGCEQVANKDAAAHAQAEPQPPPPAPLKDEPKKVAGEPKPEPTPEPESKPEKKDTVYLSAIYNVKIDPPYATLTVKNDVGTVTGIGRKRQVRIDYPLSVGPVVIEAVCFGYKSSEMWRTPVAGKVVDLQVHLEKLPDTNREVMSLTSPQRDVRDSSSWIGQWDCGDVVITLNDDFTADKNKTNHLGKWQYVNGDAHIVWNDGKQNVLRRNGQGFQKLYWEAGVSLDSPPTSTCPAVKKRPRQQNSWVKFGSGRSPSV